MNTELANQLGALESIMTKKGEPFRAKAYKKAQETVMTWPSMISSVSQLKGAPNIGTTVLEKLNEFVNTGKILLIEEEKNNPLTILTDVYGIGPKKAQELVTKHGVTSVEQLRSRPELLNDVQRVGLRYYEDILRRIPRGEIENYKEKFQAVSSGVGSMFFEIVGSYRRGASHSGDIDVIITEDASLTTCLHEGKTFSIFLDRLIERGIILEVLSRGPSKCLVIAKIAGGECARRVDFLFTSKEEYPFAVLYFTGSKLFNTQMRQRALDMGYTLNEHCISKLGVLEDVSVKTPIISSLFSDEQSIFSFLNMEYVAPDKRTGVSVMSAPVSPVVPAPVVKNTTKKRTHSVKTKKLVISESLEDLSSLLVAFRAQGIAVLSQYGEKLLKTLLTNANNAYHNETPFMSDNEFDVLEQYVKTRFDSTGLSVGAPSVTNACKKVNLPYEMASMDKIKPDTSALSAWKRIYKGPYVLSSKLDGVSGLFCTEQGKVRLYTRGDGLVGQDISHLIPYLRLPQMMNICIRGEFIISKKDFNDKHKMTFANPRNMVAGLINHKHTDASFYDKLKDVHFVAYEVITPSLKPSEQFAYLTSLNVETCLYKEVAPDALTNELLSQTLSEIRDQYVFETDGVIVCDNRVHSRPVSGNPEYAFAFKMALSEQMAHAKVTSVIWSASKDGYLKPRVQIEPICLGGVKIEYATGFNAAFIVQNKIGVGAVVEIIRSGDVIPHIKQIIVPALTGMLPIDCEYEWNETHVDIVLKNASNDSGVIEKTVTLFFKEIGVDGLGAGNVKKLCNAGYNSVQKIAHMTKAEMSGIDGFGETSAHKIRESIDNRLKQASMVTLMSASNLFGRGFGERKIAPIMEMYPDILTILGETKEEKITKVSNVKGIATKSAESFVENIGTFNLFYKELFPSSSSSSTSHSSSSIPVLAQASALHALFKKTVVLTGFRDKDFLQRLTDVGAIQGTSVSKNTFAVVVKQSGDTSSKIESAKKAGVPIFFLDDFVKTFFEGIH